MGDVLNNQAVRRKDKEYPVGMELSELQSHMTFFYQSLPPTLLFTMQNFRRFSKHEQAPTFILLHVMFHSVITLLHRPALLRSFTPNVALPIASNIDLSRSVRHRFLFPLASSQAHGIIHGLLSRIDSRHVL